MSLLQRFRRDIILSLRSSKNRKSSSLETRMSLQDWSRNGWLGLSTRLARRRSPSCWQLLIETSLIAEYRGLSADWRLNIAYNAALQAASAALAACGYRAARDAHHYQGYSEPCSDFRNGRGTCETVRCYFVRREILEGMIGLERYRIKKQRDDSLG